MELIGPSIFSVLFEFLYMIKVFLRQASLVFIHQILEQTADGFYLCRKWIVLEYLVVKENKVYTRYKLDKGRKTCQVEYKIIHDTGPVLLLQMISQTNYSKLQPSRVC